MGNIVRKYFDENMRDVNPKERERWCGSGLAMFSPPIWGFCGLRGAIFMVLAVLVLGCGNDAADGKRLEGIPADEGSISAIVRNPVSADQKEVDTSQVARMTFEEEIHDFGEIDEGALVTHTFSFTNTGAVALVISDVRSTCGCTVADWPREPISPGGEGAITARFDTKNKTGRQSKPIIITANTFPAQTRVYVEGYVQPMPES